MATRLMRSRQRLLALLAATTALGGATAFGAVDLSTASAQTAPVQQSTSRNWAGYVAGGKNFSRVSGSWVVPTAKSSSQGYSAFWVGLGGSSSTSSALEQVGTESDYAGGKARYYAWYELVPSGPKTLKLSIHPGDRISASVGVHGTSVTVSLSDLTTGKSMRQTLHMSHPDNSSAEWIAEAPSVEFGNGSSRVLPVADFGKVTFTKASATANGHTGSISDSHWTTSEVQLVSSGGGFGGRVSGFGRPGPAGLYAGSSRGATASSLTSNGSSFSVSSQSSTSSVGQFVPGRSFRGAGW